MVQMEFLIKVQIPGSSFPVHGASDQDTLGGRQGYLVLAGMLVGVSGDGWSCGVW